jgi:hypothetical protein
MLLIFGIRLFLSEVGLVSGDKQDMHVEFLKYIDDLKEDKKIRNKYKESTTLGHFGWCGYTFPCSDTAEFKSIYDHYTRAVDEISEEEIPSMTRELLDLMRSDPTKFSRQLFVNSLRIVHIGMFLS